jgi:uncharacterized protein YqjF (DUF2071 family)
MLGAAARQARSVDETAHRAWPLPSGRWVMGQTWESLVFVHWRVAVEELRPLIPAGLEIEEFDGSAWLGIVPFRLTGLRARGMTPLPGLSAFNEMNVRTYVRAADGKPGVWFFSLEATSRIAVRAARRLYRLPYFDARMALADDGAGRIEVECSRLGEAGKVFSGAFRATGDRAVSPVDSLEFFLVERYCLYTEGGGKLWRAEIHHVPWVVGAGEAEIGLNSIAPVALSGDPLCHIAEPQDVVVWPLERVS